MGLQAKRSQWYVALLMIGICLISIAIWFYPYLILGPALGIILLFTFSFFPELGLALIVNGAFVVAYFWGQTGVANFVMPTLLGVFSVGLTWQLSTGQIALMFNRQGLLVLLLGIVLAIGLVHSPDRSGGLLKVVKYFSLNAFVVIVMAFFQGQPERYLRLLQYIGYVGIGLAFFAIVYALSSTFFTFARFTVPGQNAIWFARELGYGILSVILLLSLWPSFWCKILYCVAIPIMVIFIYFSASRGPLLSLGAVLIVTFLLYLHLEHHRRWVLGLLTLCIASFWIATVIAPEPVTTRVFGLFSPTDITAMYRAESFATAWRLFLSHWLTGVGTGGFIAFGHLTYPHNIPLEFAAETGLLGLGIFIALLVGALLSGIQLLHRSRNHPIDRRVAITAFSYFLFALMNSNVSGDIPGNFELWFSMALLWNLNCQRV